MKEINNDEIIELEEAGNIRKNISGIVDAIIILALFLGIFYFMPLHVTTGLEGPVTPGLYILAVLIIYRFISFTFFTRTAGMKICRVVILNDDLEDLSVKEKIFASFFILINRVGYYNSH